MFNLDLRDIANILLHRVARRRRRGTQRKFL